ncbi:SusC/RagA family TonB-linked outer membrane protein [Danxiaibacter flavus]|uniref:SusC/RagA family TonB-linked outer membrane protein n=1 Tax=Danxiaibacter flavus TaxID=3049108 RepID=A0ABV3Z9P3_9BACT|nr:SusC/RagA family TonB-linked outer membrane protein [Chitinophagaceae bacterium DXS]
MRKLKGALIIPLLFLGLLLHAQTRTIKGKVLSATNKPIPGASVLVKGTSKGTATETDGSFTLSTSGKVILVVSSIGYTNVEVSVDASESTVPDIVLAESTSVANEVVVTALGITRQSKTLVYATQSVKPSELTGVRDANNVLNSLQGKVANAVITQGSGGPGSGARIVLRGNRSLQGDNNALIVVDGVPINNDTYSTAGSDFGSVQGSDGASNINPDDIESMTVLKGASAAALYGSQAGNGVLVITTKKGRKDRIAVDVNSGIAIETPFALPKVQNSYGQGNGNTLDPSSGESWGAKMTGQSYTNYLGQSRTYSSQPDNIKDFFRDGLSLNNSIGISGGSDKMQTYLSYTNNNIQGIIPKNDLMRNTVTLRVSNQLGKHFSTDAKVTYINQHIMNKPRTGEENAPVIDIYQIPRNVAITDAQNSETFNSLGIPVPTAWPSTLSSIYQNPYWMINRTALNETRDRIMGFISAKYQINDWLNLTGRANIDRRIDKLEELYSQGTILWATQAGGYYAKTNITTTQQWYDLILEGHNKIAKDLNVTYHAGAIYQDATFESNRSQADGLNVTNKFSLNFATNPALISSANEVQTQSVFGQASFSFKDALFLDASIRNDWDSRLPSPYSYQYYSVGGSAVLSDLFTLPKSISFLKANINYAEVGNGGQFGLLKTTYAYNQGAGNGSLTRSSTLPIPGLKPEIVKNIEAGVEARFLKDRIGFSATWYKSNSFNQLLQIGLPVATGYANKYINAGNIQNQGFELIVNATPVKTPNFSWDMTVNFSLNRSKVKEISSDLKIVYLGGGYGRSATPIAQEGGAYGDLLAFKWQRDGKGNYVVDSLGRPIATGAQEYIGNFNPKENIGFTNTFTYKRFSLRILMDGRVGGTMVSGTEMNLAFSGITEGTEKYREGGWNLHGVSSSGSSVGATIKAQDFWQIASGKRYGNGEFFAYDATSFRVRELSLGYDIPVKPGFFIKGLKVAASARNLLWLYRGSSTLDIPGLDKRKMWFDPDMSLGNGNYQGVEYGTLPATRTFNFNLRISL